MHISWNLFIFTTTKNEEPQGYKARKVISEGYASFVLQCTVSVCKYKADVTAWLGIHLLHKKINEIIWSQFSLGGKIQYVRRVYSTAINFPWLITLENPMLRKTNSNNKFSRWQFINSLDSSEVLVVTCSLGADQIDIDAGLTRPGIWQV